LGQGHEKNVPTLFICIYGPNLNKNGSDISEKIDLFPPRRRRTTTTTTTTITEL